MILVAELVEVTKGQNNNILNMRKIALTALVIVAGTVAAYSQTEQNLPTEIYVEDAKNHVQGIAYDKAP